MKTISAVLIGIVLLESSAHAGLGSQKAQYVGGTLPIKEAAEGKLDASDPTNLTFRPDKKQETTHYLPYASVTALAYGQHAGRRVGATIAWGATTLGIAALPMLFSKKRRHYLTINFKNAEGKDEAVVFQPGKDVTRSMLATLQARTGKKVEYEDEEARKSGNK